MGRRLEVGGYLDCLWTFWGLGNLIKHFLTLRQFGRASIGRWCYSATMDKKLAAVLLDQKPIALLWAKPFDLAMELTPIVGRFGT